jgi:MIP family channel proteins
MLRGTAREAAAELFGTFILIVFGCGVVAQVVLSRQTAGQYLSINLAWGLAVTMAVYIAGGVSGAHLNPAVTLALAVLRGFSWKKVPVYVLAQIVGAFLGALVVYMTYVDAFNNFDNGMRQVTGPQGTAGIFATYPQAFLSTFSGFVDQVVGTALLVGVIFGLTDTRNNAPAPTVTPIVVGLLVLLIGMTYGYNAGYAINPARDFGPRLFTFVAGWGGEVFTAANAWWWVPIAGPCVGGVLGGFLYDLFITKHHPAHVQTPSASA